MKLTTGNIETADLRGLGKFALARVISSASAPDRNNFMAAVVCMAARAVEARAAEEKGEMVLDLSDLNLTGRAELREYAAELRTEAVTEGNCPAAEFFARIEGLLVSDEESRNELERIYSLS